MRQPISRRAIFAGGLAAGGLATLGRRTAEAAPKSDPWPLWERHVEGSSATVDHGAWTALLKSYCSLGGDGIARVDYAGLNREKPRLEAYLAALSATRVSALDRPEQLAFWVNHYNALTVKVILDHYPVDSIRDIDISPGFFSDGPWGKKLVQVEGESLSLDDMEHRILRPLWRDPRIHYAVNCASLGCPNLAAEAYSGETCERLLVEGARAYINHPRGARVEKGKLVVSSIYDWFEEDFGGSEAGVIAHLRRYATAPLAEALLTIDEIGDDAYDWRLNDASSHA